MTKLDAHITCWQKVLYKELVDAEFATAELWANLKRSVMPYKCPVCPFWHLHRRTWDISWLNHLYKIQRKMECFNGH